MRPPPPPIPLIHSSGPPHPSFLNPHSFSSTAPRPTQRSLTIPPPFRPQVHHHSSLPTSTPPPRPSPPSYSSSSLHIPALPNFPLHQHFCPSRPLLASLLPPLVTLPLCLPSPFHLSLVSTPPYLHSHRFFPFPLTILLTPRSIPIFFDLYYSPPIG